MEVLSNLINLVWIKKDFRIEDNEALQKAEELSLPYLIVVLIEPFSLKLKDRNERFFKLFYKNAIEFQRTIQKKTGKTISILYSEMEDVLRFLINQKNRIHTLIAYEEYTTRALYERDKHVRKFCKNHQIHMLEIPLDCIARGSRKLHTHEEIQEYYYHKKVATPKLKRLIEYPELQEKFPVPESFLNYIKNDSLNLDVGEEKAKETLNSFLQKRARFYLSTISQPFKSYFYSSRLSHFLSFGNITTRSILQTIAISQEYPKNKRNLDAFISRLFWRRHFIQKFEKDCTTYEYHAINPYFENLPIQKNEELILKFQNAETGIPIIDACILQLKHEGWLNFRMRAMLVSFFCFYLEQDWRDIHYFLSKLFIDYEPGIHFPQIQMQAGITGYNTIRMYNPIKQSRENDPEGKFIYKWLPSLRNIPPSLVHTPWRLTTLEQKLYRFELGKNYPHPIVDMENHQSYINQYLWQLKKKREVKEFSKNLSYEFRSIS
ncbi:MAG: deoxyribodipyrimidine photo-lyase [Leptospiraceae bacterium]|nr:deoxyribodipyrimidine photo-lyase [Leptospiraceae bacterium]MDW7976263.1 FAD-binding domain-containing protein [Leptospiraceae bacterium]